MTFSVFLAVSEARAFRYIHDDREAAILWYKNTLADIAKKNIRKAFSGEIVQTYDFTTGQEHPEFSCPECGFAPATQDELADHQLTCGLEKQARPTTLPEPIPSKDEVAAEVARIAKLLCPECDFVAKTLAGLKSHIRHKHVKVEVGDDGVTNTTVDMRSGKVGYRWTVGTGKVEPVLMDEVDRDLARLRAKDNAESVGEDEDVSPLDDDVELAEALADAKPSGRTKEEMLAQGCDPENVASLFGTLVSTNIPPCPQPDTVLPGELYDGESVDGMMGPIAHAIQERPVAALGICPFCDEEGKLYDFRDPGTDETNRACTSCWIQVSV